MIALSRVPRSYKMSAHFFSLLFYDSDDGNDCDDGHAGNDGHDSHDGHDCDDGDDGNKLL